MQIKKNSLTKIVLFAGFLILASGCMFSKTGSVYVNSDTGLGFNLNLEAHKSSIKVMTVKEVISASDIIAKVKLIKLIPVYFTTDSGIYSQLAIVKVEDLLKGKIEDKNITIYAKNTKVRYQDQASYEVYDRLLVFLKQERDHYITVNNCYGQMPIYGKILTGWRQKKAGGFKLKISMPYLEAREKILNIEAALAQLEQD